MRSMRFGALAGLCGLILSGCMVDPGRPAGPERLALTGEGYPGAGDPCQTSGASAADLEFVPSQSQLIACPPGIQARALDDAIWLGAVEGWTVFALRP